jgi:hypothetical protein
LFTYNGFTSKTSTKLLAPAYMKNFYGFYATLVLANPNATDANVTITYQNGSNFGLDGATTTATRTIPAGQSITIYDGSGDNGSDLDAEVNSDYVFFGSVVIESTNNVGVVGIVNQESTAAAGSQGGSYNLLDTAEGTQKISVPLIQSNFYSFFTSLTIQSVDGTNPTIQITYNSDSTYSDKLDTSKSYSHTLVNGQLNRYEGASASADQSDLLDDAFWVGGSGTGRFIGSATIEVTSGSNIVAFVNSESSGAANASLRDSMYTYNAFNLP